MIKLLACLAALALADLTVPWLLDLALERWQRIDDERLIFSAIAFLRLCLWLGAAGLLWHARADAGAGSPSVRVDHGQ